MWAARSERDRRVSNRRSNRLRTTNRQLVQLEGNQRLVVVVVGLRERPVRVDSHRKNVLLPQIEVGIRDVDPLQLNEGRQIVSVRSRVSKPPKDETHLASKPVVVVIGALGGNPLRLAVVGSVYPGRADAVHQAESVLLKGIGQSIIGFSAVNDQRTNLVTFGDGGVGDGVEDAVIRVACKANGSKSAGGAKRYPAIAKIKSELKGRANENSR